MEKRSLNLELRSSNDDGIMKVSGIVNKPGMKSKLLYSNGRRFYEIIDKGVFAKAIKAAKEILFLDAHDRKRILASTKNGTLDIEETENGVEMSAQIVNTTYGRDAFELMNSGLVANMSFGFKCLKDSWSRDEEGNLVRIVKDMVVSEVSCLQNPAYEDSEIATRGEDVGEVEIPILEEERAITEPNVDKFDFKDKDGNTIGSIELRESTTEAKATGGSNRGLELFIYNQIGDSMWEQWMGSTVPNQIVSMIDKLRSHNQVDIRINSPGGSVFGGNAIANLLKTVPGNKTVYVDGMCASIATVIAMAADEIVMADNAMFMIHKPLCQVYGNADAMRKQIDILDKIQEGLIATYMKSAKEGVTKEQINELVNAETWMTATEASNYFSNIRVEGACKKEKREEELPTYEARLSLEDMVEEIRETVPVETEKPEVVEEPKAVLNERQKQILENILKEIKEKRSTLNG
ncbi:MAG: head maturation protease, ClpP-related [Clostridium sp.]|uniref:head maturation protease, ClpP-related n=1 Tax=Clostridium sp. TaxID=1506 RepID=UPI003F2E65B6